MTDRAAEQEAREIVEEVVLAMESLDVGPTKDWNEHVIKRRALAAQKVLAHLQRRDEELARLREYQCPDCMGVGWITQADPHTVDPCQVECERCEGTGNAFIALKAQHEAEAELLQRMLDTRNRLLREGEVQLAEAQREIERLREALGSVIRKDGHWISCPGEQFHGRPDHECEAIRTCTQIICAALATPPATESGPCPQCQHWPCNCEGAAPPAPEGKKR